MALLVVLSCGCEPQAEPPVKPDQPTRDQPTRDQSDSQTPAVDRPNLVLVIGDDHGFPYFGFMGDEIVRTPNLDRLASEGTIFRSGYVTSSVCRDSLLSLLTGLEPYQYQQRLDALASQGMKRLPWISIQDFQTLPGLLRERGYASLQTGKFWGGTYEQAGFDEGMRGADAKGQGFQLFAGGEEGLEIGRTTMEPVYDFIDRHREEPFFVWFAPMLPHSPMDAPARYFKPYAGLGLSQSALEYYANITRFDDVVGELMEHLASSGVAERTLVVYLSDNGWHQGAFEDFSIDKTTCQGAKFKETPCTPGGPHGKGSIYELGFRTPIIFRWPGYVPAGQSEDGLVSSIDVFETLLDYADVAAPPNRAGQSLRPVIEGADLSARVLIGQMSHAFLPTPGGIEPRPTGEAFFARSPAWHYIWFPEARLDELYAIGTDPEEETNVVALHPDVVADFRSQIESWKHEMKQSVAP